MFASTITQLSKVVPSPALQLAVVENGAVVLITSPMATAVRPVPRSIAVLEGAWVWPKNGPKPAVLALPQHFRSPLSRIAQVWSNPADTATAVRPVPRSIVVEGTVGVHAHTITQLSGVIPSPALHFAVVEDGTGMVFSSDHRNGRSTRAETRAEVDRRG